MTVNATTVDRNSKPAIPERPAGLARPSSLIRQHPRHSNDNLDTEIGVSHYQTIKLKLINDTKKKKKIYK